MSTMLAALPTQAQKEQLLQAFNALLDPNALGLDSFQNLAAGNWATNFPPVTSLTLTLDALPLVPSGASLLAQLQAPIQALQDALPFADMTGNTFVVPAQPTFPLAESLTLIASNLPLFPGASTTLVPKPLTALLLDGTGLTPLLAELAQPENMTPDQWLATSLQAADCVVQTFSSPDKLVNFATQAIPAFYLDQISRFDACLPLVALENALACDQPPDQPTAFGVGYQRLLDALAQPGTPNAEQIAQWLATGAVLAPALQTLAAAGQTLQRLQENNVQPLAATATTLLNLSSSDTLFLQPIFAQCEQWISQLLAVSLAPLQQLGSMTQSMQRYLDQAINVAKSASEQLTHTLTAAVEKVPPALDTCQTALARVVTDLETFVASLNVAALVGPVKIGLAQISAEVDRCLTAVEGVMRKLDAGVATLQAQVTDKVTAALQTLEAEVRKLLKLVTDLLSNQEVQAVFAQAYQALEKFKLALEQISLKPVFDLVLTKTRDMESSIKAIDAARLGVSQRTALKIGVQIIKEVKVDEQIKPELLAAFAQLRDPLLNLLAFLSEKIGVIAQAITQFDPGALVQALIEKAGPYQQFVALLQTLAPSHLLQPLQTLYTTVQQLIADLTPDHLMRKVQALYEKVAALLTIVDPAAISGMLNTVISGLLVPLTSFQTQQLPAFFQTIQESVSLEKLLAGTGLQTINDAMAWPLLMKLLGGEYLTLIVDAIEQTATNLAQAPMDGSAFLHELQTMLTNCDRQLQTAAATLQQQLSAVQTQLTAADWEALQARRADLVVRYDATPALQQLLTALDLAPVLQLQKSVAALLASDTPTLAASLTAIATVLQAQLAPLQQLSASTLQTAAPALFRQQIGDPLRQLITRLQEKLAPLTTVITAFKTLTAAVVALPAQLDALVTDFLATTQATLTALLTAGSTSLQTFGDTVTPMLQTIYRRLQQTIAQLSPLWLLNAFGAPDFVSDPTSTGETPAGLVRMARRIMAEPGDLPWPARLRTKLTADELAALQREVATITPPATLSPAVCALVYQALNRVLDDGHPLEATELATIQDNVQAQVAAATAAATDAALSETEQIAASRQRYRLLALQEQMVATETAAQQTQHPYDLLRFKRVLLEASYPADIAMSLQSLHPTLVAQLGQLYPTATVQRLDVMYLGLVDQVKGLPQQLISQPLTDTFAESKELFQANFDLAGLLDNLQRKLGGLDEDLANGLARLSVAYQRLVTTFDQRLAGAV